MSAPCSPLYDPCVTPPTTPRRGPAEDSKPPSVKAAHRDVKRKTQGRLPGVSDSKRLAMVKRTAARRRFAEASGGDAETRPQIERTVKTLMQEACKEHRKGLHAVRRMRAAKEKLVKAMSQLAYRRKKRQELIRDADHNLPVDTTTSDHSDHVTAVADCLECLVDTEVADFPGAYMDTSATTVLGPESGDEDTESEPDQDNDYKEYAAVDQDGDPNADMDVISEADTDDEPVGDKSV